MSTLKRLLWAAGPRESALEDRRYATENFTTEALAGAIRIDHQPILRLLSERGIALQVPDEIKPDVRTQLRYPQADGGVFVADLVLAWPLAEPPVTVIIEIKTGAGLSGDDQLDRLREIAGTDIGVLLSETDHTTRGVPGTEGTSVDKEVSWVSWQRLYEIVRTDGGTGEQWRDLALFLKEIGMATDNQFPLRAREVASLPDAYSLLLKMLEVLKEVNRRLRARAPESAPLLWSDGQIGTTVRRQFEQHSRLMLYGGSDYRAPFFYGLAPDRDGEIQAQVWVECEPTRTEIRSRVMSWHGAHAAELAQFQVNQDPDYNHGWTVLYASTTPTAFATREMAIEWFLDRIAELFAAGYATEVLSMPATGAGQAEPARDSMEPAG